MAKLQMTLFESCLIQLLVSIKQTIKNYDKQMRWRVVNNPNPIKNAQIRVNLNIKIFFLPHIASNFLIAVIFKLQQGRKLQICSRTT